MGLRLQLASVFGLAFVYATVRYVVFGPVWPDQIPLYMSNKAISTTAVVSLLLAVLCRGGKRERQKLFWGRVFKHSATLHALISVSILASDYFPKLYTNGTMSLGGEASILFGILALYGFHSLGKGDLLPVRWLKPLCLVALSAHLVALGYAGWCDRSGWYGGLPPISLICFVIVVSAGVALVAKRQRAP